MSASLGEKAVFYAGQNYVLTSVPYTGQATTFSVDQGVSSAVVIDPSGGPAATIGAASQGLVTITLAAGGGNLGGRVVVVTAYGKSRSSHKVDQV